jgi:CheY-like chemotaxis protein
VRDTGTGMSAEVMTRIFEPFFTTKGVGKGTGLGLATVFGIVRGTGGHIQVASEPGAGATFTIYLPTAPGEAVTVTQTAHAAGGDETILLVEDEPGVRRATRIALTHAGYRVLEASGPETALALAAAHPGFDLLLTDVVMPEISGCELAATLVTRHPDVGVLFMSGYIDDAIVRHGVASSDSFLNKPFTPDQLLHKVRELLSRRAERA